MMDDCLSENQVAEFLSGALLDDPSVNAHLDRCTSCLAIVAVALKVTAPAMNSRFTIIRHLGTGGMGTVYEAFDRARNARIALKLLRHASPDTVLRFKREFRTLQSLHHPNLVRLGELVVEDERWCFTMELLDGLRFIEYVRSVEHPAALGLGFDPVRLRDGFIQLTRGLGALHAAGKVHRDVKPSNVLVTPSGRVVLLDLGLVLDQYNESDSTGGYALGTVAYMAPEQALGLRVGPPADWYAAGVLLYQALAGQLPFTGSAALIALDKQRDSPASPCTLVPEIDQALSELCLALLRPDPAARPTMREILLALGDNPPMQVSTHTAPRAAPFIGRCEELAALASALDDTRHGQPVAVFVTGESGIGKSALVQRFAEDSKASGTVVLAGRCYERESLPFKAIDGIVDALSRYLTHLPAADAAAVLPRHAALLARTFPVLTRVEPIADAPFGLDVRDPQELRIRLFSAFRELLLRLADRHPVMLVVDDVHWADVDSFALLAELFRQPDAPSILLVATLRSPDDAAAVSGSALLDALGTEIRELRLVPMREEEAKALAAQLIARQPNPSDLDPLVVASEANGHPLFIDELVRQNRLGKASAVRLDDALWTRISQLEPVAQKILQLAALSGGRLLRRVALRAARLDSDVFELHLGVLRAANLARTTGASASDHLEPYHDRVRMAVLAHTTADDARSFHRQLALSLEAESRPDAEALALHWREAGNGKRSAEHTAEAAARASRTLAFDRAAQLYRLALKLREDCEERDTAVDLGLRIELGHALANAGRGAEAASIYLEAADGAMTSDVADLRRRASEQLIRSGYVERGIATLHTGLQPLGVTIPTTPAKALRSLLLRRAQVRLRGLGYRERDAADLPARTLTRIDFCWSLSSSLSLVDPLLGSDLAALQLLLALRAGEPARVSRALASEAVYAASVGATARAHRVRAKAHAIAAKVRQPYTTGVLGLCDGLMAALLGAFTAAYGHFEECQRILRAGATGVAWEIGVAQDFALELLGWMGRLHDLRRRVPIALHETEGRGDLYFSTSLRTGLANNLMLLQRGDVKQARAHAAEALTRWPQGGFQLLHSRNLYANTQIDLYCGNIGTAYARLIASWPQLKRSLQMRVQYFRIMMLELQIRITVAAAKQQMATAPGEARALLRQAERSIRRLRSERVGWADALAWLLCGGVAHVRGERAAAEAALQHSITAFEASDMALFASAARYRLAELRGSGEGAELSSAVTSWFARHEVVSPDRMVAMLTPAFELAA